MSGTLSRETEWESLLVTTTESAVSECQKMVLLLPPAPGTHSSRSGTRIGNRGPKTLSSTITHSSILLLQDHCTCVAYSYVVVVYASR